MFRFLAGNELAHISCRAPKNVSDVIQAIQNGGFGFCIVTDSLGRYVGSVTDGDVRRAYLSGVSATERAGVVINDKAFTGDHSLPREDIIRTLIVEKLRFMPLVESGGFLAAVAVSEVVKKASSRSAFILAGGRGRRLGKLTDSTPKPLVPYRGKAMIHWLVDKLRSEGFTRMTISVNYRAEQIREFFSGLSNYECTFDFVEESEPMGTAGPLSLLPLGQREDLLVVNADVVTTLSFRAMMDFHELNRNDITVGAVSHEHQVPFGVIREKGGRVLSIEEKPTASWFVSAGVYSFSLDALARVPRTQIGMPELINKVARDLRVSTFPIHEEWHDIGTPQELSRVDAQDLST